MPNTSVEIFLKKLLKSESKIKQKKKLRTIYSQPINLDIKPLKNSFNKSKKKLDNAANNLTEVHQKSKNQRQSKKLSAIQRKSFRKVSKNDFKDVKYDDFLGLNKLHGQYLESTLQKYVPSTKNSSLTTLQLQNIQQEFLKLDLHGCKIKIVRSKCNNLIGLEGIIIMESKFNFRIICQKDDKTRIVPKKICVFEVVFQLGNEANQKYKATIFGENFLLAPGMRILKKFKNAPNITLF